MILTTKTKYKKRNEFVCRARYNIIQLSRNYLNLWILDNNWVDVIWFNWKDTTSYDVNDNGLMNHGIVDKWDESLQSLNSIEIFHSSSGWKITSSRRRCLASSPYHSVRSKYARAKVCVLNIVTIVYCIPHRYAGCSALWSFVDSVR